MRFTGWFLISFCALLFAGVCLAPAGDSDSGVSTAADLRAQFKRLEPGEQEALLEAIGGRRGDVVDDLVALLADEDESVVRGACLALASLGQRAAGATPALLRLLEDERSHVRMRAIQALGQINVRPPALLSALEGQLKDVDKHCRDYAAHALGRIGYEAVPILRASLATSPRKLQRIIVRHLSQIRPIHPGAIEAVAEGARNSAGAPGASGMWLEALGQFGEAGVVYLLPLLDTPDAARKRKVIMVLRDMGASGAAALPTLRTLLHDPRWKGWATLAIEGIEAAKK